MQLNLDENVISCVQNTLTLFIAIEITFLESYTLNMLLIKD